jgi:hypothetical protein
MKTSAIRTRAWRGLASFPSWPFREAVGLLEVADGIGAAHTAVLAELTLTSL